MDFLALAEAVCVDPYRLTRTDMDPDDCETWDSKYTDELGNDNEIHDL